MKFSLRQSAVAAALLVSMGAQAADYNVGTLTPTAIAGVNSIASTFEDVVSFTIASPNNLLGGNVANVPVSIGLFDILDITGLNVSLANSAGVDFSSLITASGNDAYTVTGYLASGDYGLTISGVGTGMGLAGAYSYALLAVPVPEPETYALLLAGLGLLAGVARRRG